MGYIKFPIEDNAQVLRDQAYAYIKQRSPTWFEFDGNLDTWLIQVLASQASDLRILASDVPDAIFRYFGNTILGIPPDPAIQAITKSTWTAIDNQGYLIPANTLVGIRDNGGALRGFRVLQDISILPGLDATSVGEVVLIADQAGSASSDIGGPGTEAELIDPLDFVERIELELFSAGGADAESIDEYTDRLAEYMRGLSTRPILPDDYARLAKNQPSIFRAVALDGYDPSNDTYFNDRMVTLACVDAFGLDLPTEMISDLDTLMQSMREINFIINIINASRTIIDVSFQVSVLPNYSTSLVEAQCIADITDYLRPANWAWDRTITGSGADRTWIETPFVYYNEVLSVASNVQGVDHVVDMLISRQADSPARSDISLDLPAALTEPGRIDGAAA